MIADAVSNPIAFIRDESKAIENDRIVQTASASISANLVEQTCSKDFRVGFVGQNKLEIRKKMWHVIFSGYVSLHSSEKVQPC